jgi:tRNA uridine 5-carbamoylmethylation protein Kti12
MKAYQLVGIDTAMHLLRPGAKWEISNREITRWEDPRPKPPWDEIMFTIEKIKELEDAVPTILLPEQQKAFEEHMGQIEAQLQA